jgi:tetratricopeptide (TPR) repeat protein
MWPLAKGGCALVLLLTCLGLGLAARLPAVRYIAIQTLAQSDQDELALRLAADLARDEPQVWHYHRVQAWLLRRLDRIEEHLAIYDTAVETLPDLWWPYSHRCFYHALFAEEVTPSVLADCDRALALEPDWPSLAFERRGLARTLAGDRAGAMEDFRAALDNAGPRDDTNRRRRELGAVAEWLATLESGGQPFDAATMEQVRDRYR